MKLLFARCAWRKGFLECIIIIRETICFAQKVFIVSTCLFEPEERNAINFFMDSRVD